MKVLHIIARFNVGGTATWIANLSKSLMDAGHETSLIVGEVQEGEVEDSRINDIGGIKLNRLGRKVAIVGDLSTLWQIRKLIKQVNPDVINTHTAKAGTLGRLANLSLGKKRVPLTHTIHGHLLTGYFSRPVVNVVAKTESMLSQFTDVMLFAGEKVKSESISAGVKGQSATRVVMPGISINYKSKKVDPSVTVGWLARFAGVKRPDRVISIARKMPELKFLLGGDGPLREMIELDAPSNCVFVGWQEPEEFWSQCDIALLTSENEALPISLIEAQLAGLPCVTTPAGSAPEVVLDDVNGLVSQDFEVNALVTALKKLSLDKTLREDYGQFGQKRAKEVFSLERQLADHLEAYETAIKIRESKRK